jgi:hypothetical protein
LPARSASSTISRATRGKIKPAKRPVNSKEFDLDLRDSWVDGFPDGERSAVSRYAKWDENNEQWVDNRPTPQD